MPAAGFAECLEYTQVKKVLGIGGEHDRCRVGTTSRSSDGYDLLARWHEAGVGSHDGNLTYYLDALAEIAQCEGYDLFELVGAQFPPYGAAHASQGVLTGEDVGVRRLDSLSVFALQLLIVGILKAGGVGDDDDVVFAQHLCGHGSRLARCRGDDDMFDVQDFGAFPGQRYRLLRVVCATLLKVCAGNGLIGHELPPIRANDHQYPSLIALKS